jgi:hypothetical protein
MAQSRVPTPQKEEVASGRRVLGNNGVDVLYSSSHPEAPLITTEELGEDTLTPSVTPVGDNYVDVASDRDGLRDSELYFYLFHDPDNEDYRVIVHNETGEEVTYNWSLTRHRV